MDAPFAPIYEHGKIGMLAPSSKKRYTNFDDKDDKSDYP